MAQRLQHDGPVHEKISGRLLRFLGVRPKGDQPSKTPKGAEMASELTPQQLRPDETAVERVLENPFLGDTGGLAGEPTPVLEPEVEVPTQGDVDRPEMDGDSEVSAEAEGTKEEAETKSPKKKEVTEEVQVFEGEQVEEPETRDAEEAEGAHPDQDQSEDEEDRPGAGWVAEEDEQEEEDKKDGGYQERALGEDNRCAAMISDGERCLRKPIEGTPYCRGHFAGAAEPDPLTEKLKPIKEPDLPRPNQGSKTIE